MIEQARCFFARQQPNQMSTVLTMVAAGEESASCQNMFGS
jgi:hypothetical protein